MVKLFAFLCSGVPRPAWNPLASSATVVLDDITMAALSGASSHHDVAHGHDCDCRWRRACSIVGRAGPLADGHPVGALAFIRGPLGGDMVPQLAALAFPSRVVCKSRLALGWGSLVAPVSLLA